MRFEDYPLVTDNVSFEDYRIVGHIGKYPVYSKGVNPWRESALVGYCCGLPAPSELWDSIQPRGSGNNSSFFWCDRWQHDWMSIEIDTWGASDITGIDKDGSVSLTLGTHGGEPLFLELKCHTGRDVGRYDDVSEFVEPLYAILFEVLQASSNVEMSARI